MSPAAAGPPQIELWQLALTVGFVLLSGGVSLAHRLGLARDLLTGTVRTFVQLFVMGYALQFLFGLTWALPVLGVYVLMILFAARIIRGRVKEPDVRYLAPTFLSMVVSYVLVSVCVTWVIVGASPWWDPRYFLPIGGMVIGNSMTAIALALERLFSELRSRRNEVEMKLALGADFREASHDIVKSALKAGMIPSINSMMGVGVVFIPGMMTGQILAGADPLMAVRYQIVVMCMLVGSTALGSLIVVHLARRRCFGPAHSLLLGPSRRS